MNNENINELSSNEELSEELKNKNGSPRNPLFKKIVAWICIIFLTLMYVGALILAMLGHGIKSNLFMACILGTLIVPILGFIVIWLYSRYNDLKAPGDPD